MRDNENESVAEQKQPVAVGGLMKKRENRPPLPFSWATTTQRVGSRSCHIRA